MPNLVKLPDTNTYVNRLKYTSPRSGENYVVAQRRTDFVWCCACWPWRNNRVCDHLRDLHLLPGQTPVPEIIEAIGALRYSTQQLRATAGINTHKTARTPSKQTVTRVKTTRSTPPPQPAPTAPVKNAVTTCDELADRVAVTIIREARNLSLSETGIGYVLYRAAQKIGERLRNSEQ